MITSLQNEAIKRIMKLKQKKYRDEEGLFLVEGYHLVEEAIKNNRAIQIITIEDCEYDIDTLYVSLRVMEKLAFTKSPQPIMAICKKNEDLDVVNNGRRYLLLDRVQDPGNVGTMIRTALAFGYDQVILSLDCVDIYNDKVIRSTQGAIFQMNIVTMDLKDAINKLKKQGVCVYGTALYEARCIDEYESVDKMAFIMGNEGQGISDEILSCCDHKLYIPILGIESLNVAIASAITMYHFK